MPCSAAAAVALLTCKQLPREKLVADFGDLAAALEGSQCRSGSVVLTHTPPADGGGGDDDAQPLSFVALHAPGALIAMVTGAARNALLFRLGVDVAAAAAAGGAAGGAEAAADDEEGEEGGGAGGEEEAEEEG